MENSLIVYNFPLIIGYIKLSKDFTISEVKKIPSGRGEYMNNIHLESGMLIEIVKMETSTYYPRKKDLCVTIRIVKKYNLPFPNNPNRGKVYKTSIKYLEGLEFDNYKLRGNEERCQKIEKLIGVEDE